MSTTVNAILKHKRGTEESMPVLKDGQIYLCSDTNKVYKGSSSGENILICDIATLNAIANNKQDKIFDSGWLILPLTNGSAFLDSLKPRYRLIGKECRLIGMCKGYTTINTIIGTLPAGYRPIASLTCIARCGQNKYAEINVSYDGTIKLVNFSDTLTVDVPLDLSCISFFIG